MHRDRYESYLTMVQAGDYANHGFDLAAPQEIQKAIDNGTIKPFPRVKRPTSED